MGLANKNLAKELMEEVEMEGNWSIPSSKNNPFNTCSPTVNSKVLQQ